MILELLIHPAAILGFQRGASDGLKRMSRGDRRFFTKAQTAAVTVTGTAMALGVAGSFIVAIESGETVEHARTAGLVALIVGMIAVFAVLTRMHALAPKAIAGAGMLVAFAAVAIPALAEVMHLHTLGGRDWVVAAVIGAVTALPSWLFSEVAPPARATAP